MKKYNKILVLPDIHFPFANWGAIKQAKKWYDKHKPDLVIQLGDLTDQKIWSRWQGDPDDLSPSEEFNQTLKDIEKLNKMFPKLIILRGNHDERVKARAIEVGIPGEMFRDVDDVFSFPGWKWVPRGEEFIINTPRGKIMFMHGDEMGGTVAAKSRILGTSVIQGHTHKVNITYTQSSKHHIFGAEMGCLMDVRSKGAKYASANPVGVSIGFGVVKYGIPYFISYEKGVKV